MTPDFSPAMLKLFLRVRACEAGGGTAGRTAISRRVRPLAKITHTEFDMAWMGRLLTAAPRTRLWGALGVDPAESGVRLLDLGKQEKAE